jgi:hypothetical protein
MGRAEELAEEHWEWFSKTIGMVYKDAMIHGYGHGYEEGLRDGKKETGD